MERSPMFMDWQNQHSKNGYTTKSNLHVQCNSHQNPNDIVARKGRPEKKQAGVLTMRWGRGWQSREIKLKELKHEGHIALGK
jgi:hypothetical protein